MTFAELLVQVRELLRSKGRVSYRALKLQFNLDDDHLDGLKDELIEAERVADDENGKVLIWVGKGRNGKGRNGETEKDFGPQALEARHSDGERRQLTVMFCDLVGSTALSAQLDPEDYRAVVQRYQQTSAQVIQRHEGYLAQYLGDGLLVYFGYPTAHEDDARRAVRTGLEIIEAIRGQAGRHSLQVRIGIHTGLVVIGDIGVSGRTEQLALGETPNIAARIQSLAEPNTVIISAATQRLIEGQFESQPFGSHHVKGIETPIAVYHVQSERQGISSLARRTTLTPLVGRGREVGLLVDRWEQAKEGRGQVVLLSGEPGIGKSRLAYTLREHVTNEGSLLFEARCSPYYQHSAFYPVIEVLQRTLVLTRQDTDEEKVSKLEQALTLYNLQESLPLFTALLSLPTPSQYPALTLTSQRLKERTQQALLQLLVAQAERQATVSVWEDVHWVDPSSLEFLSLLIEQIPTTKLLLVLTFRPEFVPPWKPRSHLSQLVLNRLGTKHVEAMIEQAAAGSQLSPEVIGQIRVKTDGVPLFIEELTKSVIESARGVGARTVVPLQTIPATLQEALLARLDRLSTARQVAQLGATLGREFSYELLQAVTPLSAAAVHAALAKLVEAEILYQRGVGQHTRYVFKHALIQDTAYQSLLKSTRQQYHQQIAQILEERFPDTKNNQPELLAHHYTEAGLIEQAILYWQTAGEQAVRRSTHAEAISHFTTALTLLKTRPDTPERAQHELTLQLLLGMPMTQTIGYGVPEVEGIYARALALCQQVGDTPQLFPTLHGLYSFYSVHAELHTASEVSQQLLSLAQRTQDLLHLVQAHHNLASILCCRGEFVLALQHLEQGIAQYGSQQRLALATLYVGIDPGVACRYWMAWVRWHLGYPDQARKRIHEVLALTQELSHPHNTVVTLIFAATLHYFLREPQEVQKLAEDAITLATEQGFPLWLAFATMLRGWALTEQGQVVEGQAQLQQGLAAYQASGAELWRPSFLALLAQAYGRGGQIEAGLSALVEALETVPKTDERWYEAELYRLKGELLLAQESKEQRAWSAEQESENPNPKFQILDPESEAEACFLTAIEIARKQQAKSLELRAVISLSRLWQSQGKKAEAHRLLSEIYGWFTEGFDTKDLQEAKALLDQLSEG